jgi:hypothetical protein
VPEEIKLSLYLPQLLITELLQKWEKAYIIQENRFDFLE